MRFHAVFTVAQVAACVEASTGLAFAAVDSEVLCPMTDLQTQYSGFRVCFGAESSGSQTPTLIWVTA
jgi:hypothetical protein